MSVDDVGPPDVSHLPDLTGYRDDLLRTRERLAAVAPEVLHPQSHRLGGSGAAHAPALRALRLLRLLNLSRVGVVLANALRPSREIFTRRGLHFVLLAVLGIVFMCSAVELGFEQHAPGSTIHDFGDARWWSIVTVATVGYGEQYPVSPGGRGVAAVLMLVGIRLIGVLTATVASYFVADNAEPDKAELNERLDRIEALLTKALHRPDESDQLPPRQPTLRGRPGGA